MTVILTSFKESDYILKSFPDVIPYSVSRRQPKGYYYDELSFLGAYDIRGRALKLRGRKNPLSGYALDWFKYLDTKEEEVLSWLKSLDNSIDIMLCCWCPYSNSTRNQIKNYGTFACHTGLIGQVINKHRPDIDIYLDKDRYERLVSQWKPEFYKVIES